MAKDGPVTSKRRARMATAGLASLVLPYPYALRSPAKKALGFQPGGPVTDNEDVGLQANVGDSRWDLYEDRGA